MNTHNQKRSSLIPIPIHLEKMLDKDLKEHIKQDQEDEHHHSLLYKDSSHLNHNSYNHNTSPSIQNNLGSQFHLNYNPDKLNAIYNNNNNNLEQQFDSNNLNYLKQISIPTDLYKLNSPLLHRKSDLFDSAISANGTDRQDASSKFLTNVSKAATNKEVLKNFLKGNNNQEPNDDIKSI